MDEILEKIENIAGIDTVHLEEKTNNSLSILIQSFEYIKQGIVDEYEIISTIRKNIQIEDLDVKIIPEKDEWAKIFIEIHT